MLNYQRVFGQIQIWEIPWNSMNLASFLPTSPTPINFCGTNFFGPIGWFVGPVITSDLSRWGRPVVQSSCRDRSFVSVQSWWRFIVDYPLVICYIANWEDPPCYSWETHYFYGWWFRRDKEFIMLAVALNGLCLQYASVELRADRQVVLQAIRSNPYAFLGQNPQNRCRNPWKSPWTSVVYQCLGIHIMLNIMDPWMIHGIIPGLSIFFSIEIWIIWLIKWSRQCPGI